MKKVIQQQLDIYQQNLTNDEESRKALREQRTASKDEDTAQIESAITELKKDRMKDQQKLFELQSALKYIEVQCHFSGELYAANPENKQLEEEEQKIKEDAERILYKMNERLKLIIATQGNGVE